MRDKGEVGDAAFDQLEEELDQLEIAVGSGARYATSERQPTLVSPQEHDSRCTVARAVTSLVS
jgi:hypothetical protein